MINLHTCAKCGDPFSPGDKKPGLITECWTCGEKSEVMVYRAEQGDSNTEEISYDFTMKKREYNEEVILKPFYVQIKNEKE